MNGQAQNGDRPDGSAAVLFDAGTVDLMGRQETRFCPKGHDKYAPHGTYVMQQQLHTKRGIVIYTTNRCAVCRRERYQRTYKSVRKIVAGLVLALLCATPLKAQTAFPCTTMAAGASCQVTQIFLTGRYRFAVFAWEQGSGPTFPTLEMQVDGAKIGSMEIQYGDPAGFIGPFYFESDILSGSHVISAVYRGDGGRQLVVKSIVSTLLSTPPVTTVPPSPLPIATPPPTTTGEWQFVTMSVSPAFVDTMDPVISQVIYCPTAACTSQVNADGATLTAGVNRFEFRVAATDNVAVAYATLEVLDSPTAEKGEGIQFKRASKKGLPATFALVWDEVLAPGTYYLRVKVFDPTNRPSVPKVFTVKK